jgi:hypothetical protein
MNRLAAAAMLGLLLPAACATPPAGITTQQQNVANVVALEAGLTAAGKSTLACYSVPSCSKIADHAKIRLAFDAAYDAVTSAQQASDAGGSPNVAAASSALATLNALIPKP